MNTENQDPKDEGQAASAASDAPESQPSAREPATPTDVSRPDPVVAERDQLKDQLLRTAADFDNFRKRARREIEDAKLRGKDDAIKDMLPVFDNLERAVAAADGAKSVDSVVEGVKMVLKLFQDTAERMGINRIASVGERFDPQLHEAIQQAETDEHPPGTIITEVVPGYLVGQRLLRAAMVVVARKPTAPASEPSPTADENPSEEPGSDGTPA